ncbi:MAG: acyl-CoA thioesterase [Muribaculaceae bacterium]
MSDNSRIPEAGFPFNHRLELQIRFNDIDMFGHLNNSVYLQFFDLGKMNYFNTVLGQDFIKSGLYVVIVNINCNFYSPTLINEKLEVLTAVTEIGYKSLTLEQRIVNKATGDVKCIAQTIMAGFDPSTMKSAPIPEQPCKLMEKYEGRNLIKVK